MVKASLYKSVAQASISDSYKFYSQS